MSDQASPKCHECGHPIPDVCPCCDGRGTIEEFDYVGLFGVETCGRCKGDGKFHVQVKLPHVPERSYPI